MNFRWSLTGSELSGAGQYRKTDLPQRPASASANCYAIIRYSIRTCQGICLNLIIILYCWD